LTPQVVNGARSRLLLVAGGGKAPMVRRWLLRDPQLPVDRVRRSDTWAFIDPAAAAQLPASATG
jgi:6-phosphogluconolactonase/glucosamine-6-phosphate isomerase/deaminase